MKLVWQSNTRSGSLQALRAFCGFLATRADSASLGIGIAV
jgi:hypothetical protein